MKDGQPSFTAVAVANGYHKVGQLYPQQVDAQASAMAAHFVQVYCRRYLWQDPRCMIAYLPPIVTARVMDQYCYGQAYHYVGRKNAIEAEVRSALQAGAMQAVMLGGGFDTLTFRLSKAFPEVLFIEHDHPATQGLKREVIESRSFKDSFGPVSPNLRFTNADLLGSDMASIIIAAGFENQKPAVFILEGVLPYLEEDTVRQLLTTLSTISAAGSYLIAGVMQGNTHLSEAGRRRNQRVQKALEKAGESYHWSAGEAELEVLAQECGWKVARLYSYPALQKDFGDERQPILQGERGEYYAVLERRA